LGGTVLAKSDRPVIPELFNDSFVKNNLNRKGAKNAKCFMDFFAPFASPGATHRGRALRQEMVLSGRVINEDGVHTPML
jgi:hypothetical protein